MSTGPCGPILRKKEEGALIHVDKKPEPPHFFTEVQEKGEKFLLEDGWFAIHFPSLQLAPGDHVTPAIATAVQTTIKALKLNDKTCIDARKGRLRPYILEMYEMRYLEIIAPFLAREIKRQGFADVTHSMWEEYRKPQKLA